MWLNYQGLIVVQLRMELFGTMYAISLPGIREGGQKWAGQATKRTSPVAT
jgi:hypothetical protein